jgi:L-histidine N-alpha-methyltransferase
MAAEVRAGLLSEPPHIPCKYFYDDAGSLLFEEITRLPEYYQTRTEERILEARADEVVGRFQPTELVELGSGASRKTRVLLDAMARAGLLRTCVLFDINERFLQESLRRLAAAYPGLRARGVAGDFATDLAEIGTTSERRLAIFLGGTIGNLRPIDVPPFLASLSAVLGRGDGFLLGVDLVKDPARLHAAYNDAAGVTARFNRNILKVVNEALDGDFDPAAFDHVAFYDRERAWIEMRLRALRPMRVRVRGAGVDRTFEAGDEIRTEISCKYTRESLAALLPRTGLRLVDWLPDDDEIFALAVLERDAAFSRTAARGASSSGPPCPSRSSRDVPRKGGSGPG